MLIDVGTVSTWTVQISTDDDVIVTFGSKLNFAIMSASSSANAGTVDISGL